jgi:uncharacterized protein (TIGR02145 family)
MKNIFTSITIFIFLFAFLKGICQNKSEVKIGSQIWMTKNLNVDRFRNGDPINEAKTISEWKKAGNNGEPVWCYAYFDASNGVKYGKLYNWFAVNDSRGLAPLGWHIPTIEEFEKLEEFLNEPLLSTSKIKSTSGWSSWQSGGVGEKECPNCANWNAEYRKQVPCHVCKNTRYVKTKTPIVAHSGNGNNSSGFSAVPGGGLFDDFCFFGIGTNGEWWSSTNSPYSNDDARGSNVSIFGFSTKHKSSKISGKSVRCVKYSNEVANPNSDKILKDGNNYENGKNQNQHTQQTKTNNLWNPFPCVKNAEGIQINGDVATLESNGTSYTIKRNGTYFVTNDPKNGGSWSCIADDKIELRKIEESTPDSKVTTTVTNQSTVNDNTHQSAGIDNLSEIIRQVTEYGRFNFFQKSKDGMVVNRFIIDHAVDKIIDLIGNQYRGIYFDQFKYALQTIKDEYCINYADLIPALRSDSEYLDKKIIEINTAKDEVESKFNDKTKNLSLSKTGELRSFEEPDDKEYYNEIKLNTISPWDKFGIGANNISIWQRSDVGTKTTERITDISNVDKYIMEHSGTTAGCLISIKTLTKLVPGLCAKFDPKSQLGICSEEDRQSFSNSNAIDLRVIKQTVNVCNNNGNFNDDQLTNYFTTTLGIEIVAAPQDFGFPVGTTAEDRKVKRYVENQAPLRAAAYRKIIDDLRLRGIIYTATSYNGTPMKWQDQPIRNE